MKIPLHLHPADYSPEACKARALLAINFAQLNPKGFRQPRQHKRAIEPPFKYRASSLARLAQFAGKGVFGAAYIERGRTVDAHV